MTLGANKTPVMFQRAMNDIFASGKKQFALLYTDLINFLAVMLEDCLVHNDETLRLWRKGKTAIDLRSCNCHSR